MHKAKNSILPANLLKLIDLQINNVNNTKSVGKFRQKYARTNVKTFDKSMCISVNGIKLFNKLSCDTVNSKNCKMFSRKLKKCIIDGYKI